MAILKHRADLVGVIETANAGPSLDDAAWQDATRRACEALFASTSAVGFHVLDIDPSLALRDDDGSLAPGPELGGDVAQALEMLSSSDKRALCSPASPVTTLRAVMTDFGGAAASLARDWLKSLAAEDLLLVVMQPLPERTLLLWAAHAEMIALDRRERTALTQLALHIEAGYRARMRPETVRAELAEDGTVLWREDGAPHTNVLEAHGARVFRACSADARTTYEGLDLWTALVAGKVSLAPRRVEDRRRYAVIENTPLAGSLRQLTDDERSVVGLAARGLSTKLVAYALGVSSSLVSLRLALAAAKLGVSTRAELVRIAALLAAEQGPPRSSASVALTDAERDVLALLQRGLTNRQIAAERSRSVRTVANQVASLLKKTGSSSRRALVVRAAGWHPRPVTTPPPDSAVHASDAPGELDASSAAE